MSLHIQTVAVHILSFDEHCSISVKLFHGCTSKVNCTKLFLYVDEEITFGKLQELGRKMSLNTVK